MTFKSRKSLFMVTGARLGLHGQLPKDGDGHDDGIEVGAGFADATQRMGGDDNRTAEEKAKAGVPADDGAGDEGTNEEDNSSGENEEEDPDGEKVKPKKKRSTADYVRDLKRDLREERNSRATLEARLAALEKGGLPNNSGGDNQAPTGEPRPDPKDLTKYPLGVLDDGYVEDMIEWTADLKVAKALDGKLQTEREQEANQAAEQHLTSLRQKADDMTTAGAALYDDFEEIVLEGGLRGDWKLTEETFTAATKREHGAQILYDLANDPKEALRVSKLPFDEQVVYVVEKNAEIAAAKPKARLKPAAGDPPPNDAPRGRNGSNPIRADTDDPAAFRKLWHSSKS